MGVSSKKLSPFFVHNSSPALGKTDEGSLALAEGHRRSEGSLDQSKKKKVPWSTFLLRNFAEKELQSWGNFEGRSIAFFHEIYLCEHWHFAP